MTAAFAYGMSVSDILAVADWSSDSTFRKFYFRPDVARKKSLLLHRNNVMITLCMITLCMIRAVKKFIALNNTLSYSKPVAPKYNL